MKQRFELISSSLGSYFGVGYNTPDEQYLYDSGQKEQIFDEATKERIDLGATLEDAVLNFFEKKLGIVIFNRNTEIFYAFDGKVRCKIDGETIYKDEKTIVECKVSVSDFTNNKGYKIQCQTYLEGKGKDYTQILLLGLQEGRPAFKLYKRDEDMITDIGTMVDFIFMCLNGLDDIDNIPQDLIEKYSNQKPSANIDDISDEGLALIKELAEIQDEIKVKKDREDAIKDLLKMTFEDGKFKNTEYSFSISTGTRAGGFDEAMFSIQNPDIDLSQYRKPDSVYRTIRVSQLKQKEVR